MSRSPARFPPLAPALAPAAAAALALGTGCVTLGSYQSADTLGRGSYEVAVEPRISGLVGDIGAAVPGGAVAARVGLSDRVDLGGRVGSNGLDVMAKFQLTNPDSDGVTLSFAPAAGGVFLAIGDNGAGAWVLNAPLLVGVPVGRGELVLGPRAAYLGVVEGDTDDSAATVGSSLGFVVPISESLRIMPEVTALAPVDDYIGGVLYEGGVAFQLGRRD